MKKILLCLAALAISACTYICGGESDAPDIIELDDVQGCYYSFKQLDGFYDVYHQERDAQYGGIRTVKDDSIAQSIFCKKICIDSTKATLLTFERQNYWTSDTARWLSAANVDSSIAKGSVVIRSYDPVDGHFYSNMRVTVNHYNEDGEKTYKENLWIHFKEKDGVKYLYNENQNQLLASSEEYSICED